jgi:hypothetical protein
MSAVEDASKMRDEAAKVLAALDARVKAFQDKVAALSA